MSTQFCKQLGRNIQTQETVLRKQRGLLIIIQKCFSFPTIHTVSWSYVSPMSLWVQPLILKLGFLYGHLTEIAGTLQSGVNIIFSVFIFVWFFFFWGGGGSVENMRKSDWCFIESVCLLDLSDSIWCFLLHFFLSSYPPSITSDLAASQPIWFSKAPEHETETLNMGQIFILWSSLLTSLDLSKALRFRLFLISW